MVTMGQQDIDYIDINKGDVPNIPDKRISFRCKIIKRGGNLGKKSNYNSNYNYYYYF